MSELENIDTDRAHQFKKRSKITNRQIKANLE